MLMRSPKQNAVERMHPEEFLAKLMQTVPGREVLATRDAEVREMRRSAATKLMSEDDSEVAIAKIDAGLKHLGAEIESLAGKLGAAQTRQGELVHERTVLSTKQLTGRQRALAILNATAPTEMIALVALAKLAVHSARFNMNRRKPTALPIGPIDPFQEDKLARESSDRWEASFQANKNLLSRAKKVLETVNALIRKADIEPADIENVSRLREFLNAPVELVNQFGEKGSSNED